MDYNKEAHALRSKMYALKGVVVYTGGDSLLLDVEADNVMNMLGAIRIGGSFGPTSLKIIHRVRSLGLNRSGVGVIPRGGCFKGKYICS